jgi:aspartate-semialdehyde dehydrogenase
MAREARKIWDAPDVRIMATCIRVPVLRAHGIALTVECAEPIAPADVRGLLETAPGVKLVDDVANNYFPMPKDASGRDEILAGRIRADLSDPSGRSFALFVVGDQLLKGAALNAVQIAELLV